MLVHAWHWALPILMTDVSVLTSKPEVIQRLHGAGIFRLGDFYQLKSEAEFIRTVQDEVELTQIRDKLARRGITVADFLERSLQNLFDEQVANSQPLTSADELLAALQTPVVDVFTGKTATFLVKHDFMHLYEVVQKSFEHFARLADKHRAKKIQEKLHKSFGGRFDLRLGMPLPTAIAEKLEVFAADGGHADDDL